MSDYFPSKLPKGRGCCRSYMYNCWNTMYPKDVEQVIEYANRKRYSIENEKVKDDSIQITEEWQDELKKLPFVSHAKGRMTHLLKKKSKVGAILRDRKKYDHYDFQANSRGMGPPVPNKVHKVPSVKKPDLDPNNFGQKDKDDVEMKGA